MNLYIIKNTSSDFSFEMYVIAAKSKKHCKEIFVEDFLSDRAYIFYYAEITVIEDVDYPAGVVNFVRTSDIQ